MTDTLFDNDRPPPPLPAVNLKALAEQRAIEARKVTMQARLADHKRIKEEQARRFRGEAGK
jgi:hypothetical protein